MSQSICSRCLSRSLASIESNSSTSLSSAQRSAFSTTSALSAQPAKKKSVSAKPSARQGRTLRLSKNKRDTTGRPPAAGERKAIRKRIVLSNTNALEVKGLKDLDWENGRSAKLAELENQVVGLTNDTVDALRALEAFEHTQGWSLFRRPATLVRKETVEMARALEGAEGNEGAEKKAVRKILFGEKGSGKSVLLLQAQAMALQRGWIVVHLPNGQDLTNAHTSYAPSAAGKSYIQPHYTAKLLSNIKNANQKVLATLRLSQKHDLPMPVQGNISLDRFAEMGARDPDLAWPIYSALMKELTALSNPKGGEGLQRPPLLMSMDALDHTMRPSAYLNTDAKPIHAHDLSLIAHYLSCLNGSAALPNGGMVLAAVSESNRAASPSLDHILASKHGAQTDYSEPVWDPHAGWNAKRKVEWDPYAPFDERVGKALEKAEVLKVLGLSKEEAKGIMEYYALSGMLRAKVTEGLVSEKWTLSGGGIVGQLERGAVRARF